MTYDDDYIAGLEEKVDRLTQVIEQMEAKFSALEERHLGEVPAPETSVTGDPNDEQEHVGDLAFPDKVELPQADMDIPEAPAPIKPEVPDLRETGIEKLDAGRLGGMELADADRHVTTPMEDVRPPSPTFDPEKIPPADFDYDLDVHDRVIDESKIGTTPEVRRQVGPREASYGYAQRAGKRAEVEYTGVNYEQDLAMFVTSMTAMMMNVSMTLRDAVDTINRLDSDMERHRVNRNNY